MSIAHVKFAQYLRDAKTTVFVIDGEIIALNPEGRVTQAPLNSGDMPHEPGPGCEPGEPDARD